MKFRKRNVVVNAVQWLKIGDHPDVKEAKGASYERCQICCKSLVDHGMLTTFYGQAIVCPGDWILTDEYGNQLLPLNDNRMSQEYEKIDFEMNSVYARDCFIDATPDGQYAVRVLKHFLSRAQERWATDTAGGCDSPFWNQMNEVQVKRQLELESAVNALSGHVVSPPNPEHVKVFVDAVERMFQFDAGQKVIRGRRCFTDTEMLSVRKHCDFILEWLRSMISS